MRRRVFWVVVLVVLLQLLIPASVFAATGETMPWDDALQRLLNILTSNTVRIIGILMIVAAGLAIAFTEGQGLKRVLWVVIGIGVAINAASLATTLFGNGAGLMIPGL